MPSHGLTVKKKVIWTSTPSMLIFGFHNSRNSLLVSKLHFYSALQEDEKGKRETEETEKTKYKTRKESVYHKVKVIHLLQLNYFNLTK